MRRALLAIGCALLALHIVAACYKGDPGYGGPDYPPEPPFAETPAPCLDGGNASSSEAGR